MNVLQTGHPMLRVSRHQLTLNIDIEGVTWRAGQDVLAIVQLY